MDQSQLSWIASFIWGIADDVLRDLYVRGKYRDVILPMTVIRRLDSILEPGKSAVLELKAQFDVAQIHRSRKAMRQFADTSIAEKPLRSAACRWTRIPSARNSSGEVARFRSLSRKSIFSANSAGSRCRSPPGLGASARAHTQSDMMIVADLMLVSLFRGTEFTSRRGNMAKTVTLRLEKDAYDELQEAALAQRRPLATFIATAALAQIREAQFVDDEEMAEILGNDALLRRLKAGSQQARQRRGNFVA